jgi:hypothetical protein
MPRGLSFPRPLVTVLIAVLAAGGCAAGDDDEPAVAESTGDASDQAAPVSAAVPDACTFFSRAELEAAVGWELREGEPESAPEGSSSCDFEMPPQMYVTRTFPNPPLPKSVDFSSLMVTTYPATADDFGEMRNLTTVEDAPGIGDDAYFLGPDLLHVRVGNRGFSLRIYTNASAEADAARVRDVMLSLARTGASRL